MLIIDDMGPDFMILSAKIIMFNTFYTLILYMYSKPSDDIVCTEIYLKGEETYLLWTHFTEHPLTSSFTVLGKLCFFNANTHKSLAMHKCMYKKAQNFEHNPL